MTTSTSRSNLSSFALSVPCFLESCLTCCDSPCVLLPQSPLGPEPRSSLPDLCDHSGSLLARPLPPLCELLKNQSPLMKRPADAEEFGV